MSVADKTFSAQKDDDLPEGKSRIVERDNIELLGKR